MPKKHVDEARLLELYGKGWSLDQVGIELGISRQTVSVRLKELGVPRRKRAEACKLGSYRKLTNTQVDIAGVGTFYEQRDLKAVELYQRGLSARAVGAAVGCSGCTVINVLVERGIERRSIATANLAGRKARTYWLNEEKVRQLRIVALFCRNWTKLGKMFEVYPSTAQRAALGQTWKHLPMPALCLNEAAAEAAE